MRQVSPAFRPTNEDLTSQKRYLVVYPCFFLVRVKNGMDFRMSGY